MKGYIRIGGSLLVGIIIVLGAFYLRSQNEARDSQGALVAVPERSYIETSDSDNDGIPDWEESLSERVFATIDTPTSTDSMRAAESYVPPTTFTGKFAEAFFKDYMSGKVQSADGTIDTTSLVEGAVQAVESNTGSKEYTPLDINIIPDSNDALRTYGNEISRIVLTYSIGNINEASILQKALEDGDAELLKELEPIRAVYENMIRDTLLVPTPEILAKEHLSLLTSYEAIRLDISAMEQAFEDPLFTLARMKRYQDDAAGLYYSLKSISDTLKESDVLYSKDEPGSFFYTLGL